MTCGSIFDPSKARAQLDEIEKQIADPNIWSNPARSQTLMRERKRLEVILKTEEELGRRVSEIETYFELAGEGEMRRSGAQARTGCLGFASR